jgi:hypothetical protein
MPPRKKTPKKAKAVPVTAPADEDESDHEDEVEGMSSGLANLALTDWFKIDRTQMIAYIAFVYANRTLKRYVHVRAEFVGSIVGTLVSAKMINEGEAVQITSKFRNGGELTNPVHTMALYRQYMPNGDVREGITDAHPLYVRLGMINRIENEANREQEQSIIIDLPFPCNKSSFHDPIRDPIRNIGYQQTVDFDVFPLTNQPTLDNAPAPSTKFLHLTLEERDTPVHEQVTVSQSRFAPQLNRGGAGEQQGQRRGRDEDAGDHSAAASGKKHQQAMEVEQDDDEAGRSASNVGRTSLQQGLNRVWNNS